MFHRALMPCVECGGRVAPSCQAAVPVLGLGWAWAPTVSLFAPCRNFVKALSRCYALSPLRGQPTGPARASPPGQPTHTHPPVVPLQGASSNCALRNVGAAKADTKARRKPGIFTVQGLPQRSATQDDVRNERKALVLRPPFGKRMSFFPRQVRH